MDPAFPSGRYKFIQKDKSRDRKSIIFVKLTDSAHRTLNAYLKNRDTCSKIPTIEFQEESGFIEIPTRSKGVSQNEPCSAEFKFDVESNVAMQGLQGRFECIKYKRGSKKIEKYGPLTKRLKIHAKDDVFEKTKNRMAEVELEQRKICTKKIDLKLETVNRHVKIERNSKLKTVVTSSNVPVLPVALTRDVGMVKGTPKLIRSRNKSQNILTKLNSPIARRPLKERLIHMLAVRPLKKIELSATLRKDGLRDSDKFLLHSTLMSIATVKDNVYHLLRHVWNDVIEDWPFYNDEERQQVKRNKPSKLPLPGNASSVSSNLSPKNSPSVDWSPSRPGYMKGADGIPTKRVRISHCSKPYTVPIKQVPQNDENAPQISPSRVTNGFDDIIKKFGLSNTAPKISPFKHGSKDFTMSPIKSDNCDVGVVKEENCNSEIVEEGNSNSKTIEREYCDSEEMKIEKSSFKRVEETGLLSDDLLSRDCSISSVETSSYTEKYTTITSTEQRRQYKNDFSEYYAEYMAITGPNSLLIKVHEEFVKFKKSISQYEEGSPEYLELEKQIKRKYKALTDVNYHNVKKRHDYLHNLLTHIKKLVYEYDYKMT